MLYFSTSGRNPKTGSWLFCHETDDISVPKFTLSHKKVFLRRFRVTFRYMQNQKYRYKHDGKMASRRIVTQSTQIVFFFYSGQNLVPKNSRFRDKKNATSGFGVPIGSRKVPHAIARANCIHSHANRFTPLGGDRFTYIKTASYFSISFV